jgi:hypothetical protein
LSDEQRFWNLVEIVPGHCWKWKGGKTKGGYGVFALNGKHEYAHRVSYVIHKGPIPDGLFAMHTCDNVECVNPDHLIAGTAADNAHDRDAKGRGKWGTKKTASQAARDVTRLD